MCLTLEHRGAKKETAIEVFIHTAASERLSATSYFSFFTEDHYVSAVEGGLSMFVL